MPSKRKHRMKRNTLTYANKKRINLKNKKKEQPSFLNKLIKENWNEKKTLTVNFKRMGLASNPNKSLETEPQNIFVELQPKKPKKTYPETEVVSELKQSADEQSQWREKLILPSYDQHFCKYMLDTYVDDYKEMARDRKNIFQLTPAQLRKKMKGFHISSVSKHVKEGPCRMGGLPSVD